MHQKCAACSFRIACVVDMHLARRSLPVSREYRHQAKPDAEIGMWLCLVLIFARDMERPKCQVHVHGHARHFHARSVIDHDPIVTSVCLQVPRDTERPPCREAGVPSRASHFRRRFWHCPRDVSAPLFYPQCNVLRSPPIPRVSIVAIQTAGGPDSWRA